MSLLPRVQVTTTTVFTGPTDSVQAAPRAAADVPIGAIVGGSCAGVLLAVVLVVGWRCWGRSLREQQRKAAEKRRTAAAVEAYRRSVVDGKRGAISRPRRSGPLRPASQNTVTFAADAQPRSSLESPSPSPPTTLASSPPFARPRTRTHGPSPLAPPAFRRAHVTTGSASSTAPLLAASAPASTPASPERATFPDPVRRERPAGNSALDPTASDSQRWSWRRLLTGPGFSFAQLGIGTGNDRLSAGSSSLNHWEEETPEYPIGFAYTPEDVQAVHPRSPPEHGHPLPDLDYPPEYFDYSKEEKASVHV